MEIVDKAWVYLTEDDYTSSFKKELKEYEFEGKVDFSFSPIFSYDTQNKLVVNTRGPEHPSLVLVDKKQIYEVEITNVTPKSTDVVTLSKNYGLQQFFDEHKNAKCIVFYLCNGTIFHEGYRIRVFIDE